MKPLRQDRGAAALEFALLLPALLIMLAVVMAAGRMWIVRSEILAVARQAAREAVLQPDAGTAANTAQSAGNTDTGDYKLNSSQLTITPQGPFAPGAFYKVSVTYKVSFGDLPGFGFLPGSVTLSATGLEPIDPETTH